MGWDFRNNKLTNMYESGISIQLLLLRRFKMLPAVPALSLPLVTAIQTEDNTQQGDLVHIPQGTELWTETDMNENEIC